MDIMNSKKTLLSLINGGILGSASAGQTVKFAYTENIAKVGTAAEGTITFYADTTNKTGIIAVGGDVVSSKILNVTSTAVNNGKTGENTITVTFFNASTKAADTITFDVVNAAAAKAYFEDYFTNSDTITITDGTADVNVDGQTILIDSASKYLKSGLNIAYIAESGSTGATIALRDNSNTVLSSIEVSDIVGDGVLKDSIYHQDTNILELRFGNGKVYNPNDPTTYTKVEVNLQKLIDINDVFIGNDSSIYLNATLDASTVTLDTKMQDPSTASANATGLADAWKVKQYVDSKSSDLGVTASGDAYVDASVDANDNKHINVAATAKTQTAVALAETAVQNVVEGTSTENYVALNVSAKSDASVITITTDDSALNTKIAEIDASIDNLQAKDEEIDASIDNLQAKDIEIDSSIDRLDASVSAIEAAIEAMDATESDNVLDGSIAITVTEANGVITGVDLEATKSTVTFDNTPGAFDLTATSGLLVADAIPQIKAYVDAKSGALDSSVTGVDAGGFVTVNTVQTDGALSAENVTVVYGDYADPQTDGIAKTSTTKTYVDAEISDAINALDTSVSDSDASNFVTVKVVEENGLLTSDEVTVTYAEVTAAPGDITVTNNGIVKGDVLEAAIEGALTWTVLS